MRWHNCARDERSQCQSCQGDVSCVKPVSVVSECIKTVLGASDDDEIEQEEMKDEEVAHQEEFGLMCGPQ